MHSRFILVILLLTGSGILTAQKSMTDSVYHIPDVQVMSHRNQLHAIGATSIRIDTTDMLLFRSHSLASLLEGTTGVQINSYGLSGLSNVSVRGGGTARSVVTWNGLNLANPMNGGTNLSLFPVVMIENVVMQFGGSGALFGSGAMGGSVHLSGPTKVEQEDLYSIGVMGGSFNHKGAIVRAQNGFGRHMLVLKGCVNQAKNDFRFQNTARYGDPIQKQTNSASLNYGAALDYVADVMPQLKISTSLWYSGNHIEIPTRMTMSGVNNEEEKDRLIMATANARYLHNNASFSYKWGYLFSGVDYSKLSSPKIQTESNTHSLINELEGKWNIAGNHTLTGGLNFTREWAKSEGYSGIPRRNRLSFFSFYQYMNSTQTIHLTASCRTEMIDNEFIPMVYSAGYHFNLAHWILFTGSASKTYRIPSFNDLYWIEGTAYGNPNLKPETGWSAETGFEQSTKQGIFQTHFSQTLFYNTFRNWVSWLPDEDGNWSPSNKEKGVSYGVELRLTNKMQTTYGEVFINASYYHTRSKIQSKDEYNNCPMIYVPEHSFLSQLGITRSDFITQMNVHFVGKRYYDYQNNLNPYFTGDWLFTWNLPDILRSKAALSFQVFNLWNTSYQVMAWYAMPERHYSFSLSLTL